MNKFIKKENCFLTLFYLIFSLGIYSVFWINNIKKDSKNKNNSIISKKLIFIYSILIIIGIIGLLYIISLYYLNTNNIYLIFIIINLGIGFLGNISMIIYILLILQVKKYLEIEYNLKINTILTIAFAIIYLQFIINKEYKKIESKN